LPLPPRTTRSPLMTRFDIVKFAGRAAGLVALALAGCAPAQSISGSDRVMSTSALAFSAPALQPPVPEDSAIRPFHAHLPQAELDDLRQRLAMTRWPDRETVPDRSQGAQLAKVQDLVRYWSSGYDWRKAEARLNAYPQFTTTIDGLEIHFIHVRSR